MNYIYMMSFIFLIFIKHLGYPKKIDKRFKRLLEIPQEYLEKLQTIDH